MKPLKETRKWISIFLQSKIRGVTLQSIPLFNSQFHYYWSHVANLNKVHFLPICGSFRSVNMPIRYSSLRNDQTLSFRRYFNQVWLRHLRPKAGQAELNLVLAGYSCQLRSSGESIQASQFFAEIDINHDSLGKGKRIHLIDSKYSRDDTNWFSNIFSLAQLIFE